MHSLNQSRRLERSVKQKRELRAYLEEVQARTSNYEELIKELQQIQVELDGIAAQKKTTKGRFMQNQKKLAQKLESAKTVIEKLDLQIEELEVKEERLNKVNLEEQNQRLEGFKNALKPLEDTKAAIANERKSMNKQKYELQHRLNNLNQKLQECSAQVKTKQTEIEKAAKAKEQVSKYHEELNQQHPLLFKEFFQELETKKALELVSQKKKEHLKALKDLDTRIAEFEENTPETQLNSSLKQSQKQVLKEIEELETQFSEKLTPELKVFMQELLEAKNIGTYLKKEQFELVEEEELKLVEAWKNQESLINYQMQEINTQVEELEEEKEVLEKEGFQDSELDSALEELYGIYNNMKHNKEKLKKDYNYKLALIGDWKNTNRNCLLIKENPQLPSDREILKELKRNVLNHVKTEENYLICGNLLENYLNKLISRENLLQESRESNPKSQTEIKQQKLSLQNEREHLHQEYLTTLELEKKAKKKYENAKLKVASQRSKQIEAYLEESLSKRRHELLSMKKTYGENTLKKYTEQERKKASELIKQQESQVKQKFEEIHSNLSLWEEKSTCISEEVNTSLEPQIAELKDEINATENQVKRISEEILVLKEAEEDLQSKVEELTSSKQKTFFKLSGKFLDSSLCEIDYEKLETLKKTKNKKEQVLYDLEHKFRELEEKHEDQMQEITVQEAKFNSRLKQISEEVSQIEYYKKTGAQIKEKLKIVEKEIEDLGEVSDNIFQEEESFEKSFVEPIFESEEIPQHIEESEIQHVEPANSPEETIFFDKPELPKPEVPKPSVEFNLQDCTQEEKDCLKSIKPLLEGLSLYKKQTKSLKHQEFDPLLAESLSPESCGYLVRNFKLNKQLTKIDIRQPSKPGIESSIIAKQILNVVIPKHTSEIIKAQKQAMFQEIPEASVQDHKNYTEMKNTRLIEYQSETFKRKSANAKHFVLFVTIEKGGRVELVAEDYYKFKTFTKAVRTLVRFKKHLPKLRFKIVN